MTIRSLLLSTGALFALSAAAADLRPGGMFVQAGAGDSATKAVSIGAVWPWAWQRDVGPGRIGGYTEAYVSHWRASDNGQRVDFTHLGLVPMLRYRFAAGASPWFIEGGIGLTFMDRMFRTSDKQFSTRFNFADVVGVGRSFGEQQRQEVTLRLTHFSNGGVKHPNPGLNMVRLRYGWMF